MLAKDSWIEIDGVQVHYLSGGGGPSTLVLIHGGGADSASLSWGPSIDELASTCLVIAPDLPGFGESDKPKVNYTLDYYTRFLERFTRELDLSSFSLGGLSMGGQISLNFTLQFPLSVRKLVLVGSAGLGTKLRWQILGRLGGKFPGFN
jgi:pimeloyl-ACP methyl ester carboxylesterase